MRRAFSTTWWVLTFSLNAEHLLRHLWLGGQTPGRIGWQAITASQTLAPHPPFTFPQGLVCFLFVQLSECTFEHGQSCFTLGWQNNLKNIAYLFSVLTHEMTMIGCYRLGKHAKWKYWPLHKRHSIFSRPDRTVIVLVRVLFSELMLLFRHTVLPDTKQIAAQGQLAAAMEPSKRVNIGFEFEFERWRQLIDQKGFKTNAELANFLLNR